MKYATLTYRVKRQSESPSEEWAEMLRPSRSSGEFRSGKEPFIFGTFLTELVTICVGSEYQTIG